MRKDQRGCTGNLVFLTFTLLIGISTFFGFSWLMLSEKIGFSIEFVFTFLQNKVKRLFGHFQCFQIISLTPPHLWKILISLRFCSNKEESLTEIFILNSEVIQRFGPYI